MIKDKPISLALTCAAYYWFQPEKDIFSSEYRDLDALLSFIDTMLNNFDSYGWLNIELPVEPYGDLNGGMSENHMSIFREKLEGLRNVLRDAKAEDLEDEACKLLRKQFGDEFPVPERKDTARKVATAGFAPAGASA